MINEHCAPKHDSEDCTTDIVGESPAPCALAALAARQDNIIARLEELRDQVGMWFCSGGITEGEEKYALCLHLN